MGARDAVNSANTDNTPTTDTIQRAKLLLHSTENNLRVLGGAETSLAQALGVSPSDVCDRLILWCCPGSDHSLKAPKMRWVQAGTPAGQSELVLIFCEGVSRSQAL